MTKGAIQLTVAGGLIAAALFLLPGEEAQPTEPIPTPSLQIRSVCARGPALSCDALDPGAKKGASRYKRIRTHSTECANYRVWPDGGTDSLGTESHPFSKDFEIVPGSCVAAKLPAPDGGGVAVEPQACACRKSIGECLVVTDAGAFDAPKGKTLGPGYPPFETWTGSGCQPKACTEILGEPSWPTNCPKR